MDRNGSHLSKDKPIGKWHVDHRADNKTLLTESGDRLCESEKWPKRHLELTTYASTNINETTVKPI